ncbi:MAG: hypothetical protein FWF53_09195 [Candidatus Azobacteroides sp.]|nr:hypothetical protein [Candidatus Azobacteroides sp.]
METKANYITVNNGAKQISQDKLERFFKAFWSDRAVEENKKNLIKSVYSFFDEFDIDRLSELFFNASYYLANPDNCKDLDKGKLIGILVDLNNIQALLSSAYIDYYDVFISSFNE